MSQPGCSFSDDLLARTVTYRVRPDAAAERELDPFEITTSGDLDDRIAAVGDAVEDRLGGAEVTLYLGNDGDGVIVRPGTDPARFTVDPVNSPANPAMPARGEQ